MNHKCLRTAGANDWSHADNPCDCNCTYCDEWRRIRSLPPIDLNDVRTLWRIWATELTPGPWKYTQLQGFGPNNYVVTDSRKDQWSKVVAQFENAGTFEGMQALAACRDLVPRLLTTIHNLSNDNDKLRHKIEELEEAIDEARHHAMERSERD